MSISFSSKIGIKLAMSNDRRTFTGNGNINDVHTRTT
jgi:hypothetical protein